jgi:dihydroflavonol-4-reductase
MTVVVTGASGHVGANLVRALLDQGRSVRALVHHDRRGIEGLDLDVVQGDVRDLASLERAFAGAEVVYHCAARVSIQRDEGPLVEACNVEGPRYVVEACLRTGVRRLIHFSSIHAFQQHPLDEPLDETRAQVSLDRANGSRRASPYDRSKAAGEREVRQGIARGLDAVILNPTAVIGPHDYRPSHIGQVVLDLCRRRLPALVAGGFNWVDVRDVVAGALRAEQRAPTGASYLLVGHWVPVHELAATVADLSGVPTPRLVCPAWLAASAAPLFVAWGRLRGERPLFTPFSVLTLRDSNRTISYARAAQDLDYAPRPFQETIADTLGWFQSAGLLPASLPPHTQEER